MTLVGRVASVLLSLYLNTWLSSSSAATLSVSQSASEQQTTGAFRRTVSTSEGVAAVGQAATEVSLEVGPQPILFRQGPMTANRRIMTADVRFRRTERVHLELPVSPGIAAGSGRLLDSNGVPLDVPVDVSARTDARTGQRWITADLTLAPLAPADYVIEVRVVAKPDTWRAVATDIRIVK